MTGVMCSNMLSNEAGTVAIGNSGSCVRSEGLVGNMLPREGYCGLVCTGTDAGRVAR